MGWDGLKWLALGWEGFRSVWASFSRVGASLLVKIWSFCFLFFRVEPAGFVRVGAHWIAPVSTNDGVGRVKASVFIWRRLAFPKKKIKSNKKAKHILPSKRKPSNNSVTRTQPIVAGHGKGAKKTKGFGYHRRRLAVDGRPMSARAVCRRIDFGRLLPFFVLFRRFSFLSLVLFPFRRPTMKPEKNSNPIWKIKKKYAIITKTIDITRQNSVKPCKTMKKSCQTQRNPMKPSQFRLNPVKPNKTQ